MKTAIISHKACWRSSSALSGFASDGGFPFQIAALSELFDETRLLVPIVEPTSNAGEVPLIGSNLSVVPLTPRRGVGSSSKLSFLPWLLRNGGRLILEVAGADAIHTPVPGDVGTVGMVCALCACKPLFVRHCGNWLRPRTSAEKAWRWLMETFAGGQNVMLATGGTRTPPSTRNPQVRWIFSSSLREAEIQACARLRALGLDREIRLLNVARQEPAKGSELVVQSLPLLAKRFPRLTFEIVGEGSAVPSLRKLVAQLDLGNRVVFSGKLGHSEVLSRLKAATLFTFPTTSSDGFPKVVLEALATGLPVVATRVSVLPQLLSSGAGVLLNAATPAEVAQGIEDALSDPVRYANMSQRALETARQYSLEHWRDEIGALLKAAWGPLKASENSGKQSERQFVVAS